MVRKDELLNISERLGLTLRELSVKCGKDRAYFDASLNSSIKTGRGELLGHAPSHLLYKTFPKLVEMIVEGPRIQFIRTSDISNFEKVEMLRERTGLRKTVFSERIGRNKSYYGNTIKNNYSPSLKFLLLLYWAFPEEFELTFGNNFIVALKDANRIYNLSPDEKK